MTGCVEFDGYRDRHGYGRRTGTEARIYGTSLVHRQVWIKANGSIPDGLIVMHLCDNTSCMLLAHLRLGTQADNLADMRAKGRWRKRHIPTHCPIGHPYDEANTYITRDGWRWCRECGRRRARDYQRRLRAAAKAQA